MKRWQVIGGQYESKWYGESDSLERAKKIASSNEEYWDNWQGWHTPKIYAAEDVREVESAGRITTRDGEIVRVPAGTPSYIKPGSIYYDRRSRSRWINYKKYEVLR